jgi:CheY-like chemotaxis protein
MPSGGAMVIRTMNASLTARAAARYPDAQAGEYVVVQVTDTGAGMPPDVLERATEPFFTTKEVGQGTGLGLSQVHGFVRQSGGFLTLDSTPGKGTTVRLYFPKVVASAPALSSDPAPASGSGTVLVVEDDLDVRDLLLALLDDLAFTSLAAANGPEAMQLLQDPENRIDLLLTDMVMPGGMTGLDLIRAARSLRPDLPAVLTSGYLSGNVGSPSGEEDEFAMKVPMLSKPYQQEELARMIGQVLRQPDTAPRSNIT